MNGIILLCPGQGAQSVGMGKAWFEASSEARRVFQAADEILGARLGAPLSTLCFEGPDDLLNRTDVAQPAIFTVSVACYRAAFSHLSPDQLEAVAGLSLGEYTALHLAGAMSFADGLRLVTLRGRAMQDAATAVPSGMVALIGADPESAATVCERAAEGGVFVPANYNAPGQIVISGDLAACDRAVTVAAELGLRASKLAVAGAFHSPLMAPAADRLAEALEAVPIERPMCPVISNVTALPHGAGDDRGMPIERAIRKRLVEQLTMPVRWSQSCAQLVQPGGSSGGSAREFHELAPGKVLSGLMRRIDKATKVINHDQPEG